jgi:alpha-tubulin suppressor-like RCC1 family protein
VFSSAAALVIGVLGCGRDAESPTGPAAAPEPAPSLAEAAAGALVFSQVSSDGGHSCGITADNRAYCWGENDFGELGDGTTNWTLTPVAVAGGHLFRQMSTGDDGTCAVTTDYRAYCWGLTAGDGTDAMQLTPVPVSGGLQFLQVDAGEATTCGVTTPTGGPTAGARTRPASWGMGPPRGGWRRSWWPAGIGSAR